MMSHGMTLFGLFWAAYRADKHCTTDCTKYCSQYCIQCTWFCPQPVLVWWIDVSEYFVMPSKALSCWHRHRNLPGIAQCRFELRALPSRWRMACSAPHSLPLGTARHARGVLPPSISPLAFAPRALITQVSWCSAPKHVARSRRHHWWHLIVPFPIQPSASY